MSLLQLQLDNFEKKNHTKPLLKNSRKRMIFSQKMEKNNLKNAKIRDFLRVLFLKFWSLVMTEEYFQSFAFHNSGASSFLEMESILRLVLNTFFI